MRKDQKIISYHGKFYVGTTLDYMNAVHSDGDTLPLPEATEEEIELFVARCKATEGKK